MSREIVTVNFNVNLDMVQMATWPPETVTAFMRGLAQVISAQQVGTSISSPPDLPNER